MVNLDERYHDYLINGKLIRMDGVSEKLIGYGWHCDGNEIKGHYVTTNNHKLYYNMSGDFVRKEQLVIA